MNCPNKKGQYELPVKTSEFYRTCNLPKRFEHPTWFYGYGIQRSPPEHPFYRTTSGDYGRFPPTVHTIPTSFFPNNQEFSNFNAKAGMYRNYSLNTGMDPPPYYMLPVKTSEFYRSHNLPKRFENPTWFYGYGIYHPEHPFYITTSSDYGRYPPPVDRVPTSIFPNSREFNNSVGMYRNYPLDMGMDSPLY